MKITNRKFLVAGLLAGALTFVGCKSEKSAERPPDATQMTPPPDTTAAPPATNPGTGGSGDYTGESNISTTKQSDDNLRMPEDDPLRLKDGDKNIRDSESEQGVHKNSAAHPKLDPNSGTGGSGFNGDATDDNLNDGGNVDDSLRLPDAPLDNATGVPDDSRLPDDNTTR